MVKWYNDTMYRTPLLQLLRVLLLGGHGRVAVIRQSTN